MRRRGSIETSMAETSASSMVLYCRRRMWRESWEESLWTSDELKLWMRGAEFRSAIARCLALRFISLLRRVICPTWDDRLQYL